MAAVCQIHGENGVAWSQGREVYGHVGLGAGMRLDISFLGVKDSYDAVDGLSLDLVDECASSVIATAGISFGVFVGENGALCLENGGGRVGLGQEYVQRPVGGRARALV